MGDFERTTVTRTVDAPATSPASPETTVDPASAPVAPREQRTIIRERAASRPTGLTVLARLVTLVFAILQVALLLRLVLLLLGADQGNGIVHAILASTDPFVEPFRGMFRLDRLSAEPGSILDVAALTALVGWTLVEALALAVLRIGDRRTVQEV